MAVAMARRLLYLETIRAGGSQRFDGSGIDAFNRLRIELAQRGDCMQREGQHAAKGPQAHPHGKDNGPHQRLDGTHDVERGPHNIVDGAGDRTAPHQVAGSHEAYRQGKDHAQDGGQEGQGDRLANLFQYQAQGFGGLQGAIGLVLLGADDVGLGLARCRLVG
jgi:hypothetical protein